MARFVVLFSIVLAGCDVGELPGTTTDGGGSGSSGGDGGGSGSGSACVDTVTPAATPHGHGGVATATNAGMGCLNQGCHLTGGAGPTFSFAGTVYTDTGGTTPKPGATIKVEFGGMTITAVSDEAGNFYSSQPITFPAKTHGTACPTVAPMVGQIVQGGGNCNNCHVTGGTTSPIYIQ